MVYDDLKSVILGPTGQGWQRAPYGAVSVTGPDARDFLHRMCSQDVHELADGASAPAAFFDGKGKLVATCWIGAVGERIWLSSRTGTAEKLAEMLERYHFSEQLTVAAHPELTCIEVLGEPEDPRAREVSAGIELAGARGDTGFRRYHLAAAELEDSTVWNPGGVAPLSEEAGVAVPYLLRLPEVGVDSEPNTLGLEWGIADHISLTKGCYTGQEIVARIHTYGHTNRTLCLLGIEGTGAVEQGTTLVESEDGDPVGRVMSAVGIPGQSYRVGFGFLPTALAAEEEFDLALAAAGGDAVKVLPWGIAGTGADAPQET